MLKCRKFDEKTIEILDKFVAEIIKIGSTLLGKDNLSQSELEIIANIDKFISEYERLKYGKTQD